LQHAQNFHRLRTDAVESQIFTDSDMADAASDIVPRCAGERVKGKQAPTLLESFDDPERGFGLCLLM
jgi:hypothetical protein